MKILSSNLAMRFYKKEGWSEELLKKCLMPGSRLKFFNDLIGDWDMAYWVLEVHSHFDLKRLKPHVTEIRNCEGKLIDPKNWDSFLTDLNW